LLRDGARRGNRRAQGRAAVFAGRAAGCINMQFFKWQYLEKYARLFEKNARVFGKNWHFR